MNHVCGIQNEYCEGCHKEEVAALASKLESAYENQRLLMEAKAELQAEVEKWKSAADSFAKRADGAELQVESARPLIEACEAYGKDWTIQNWHRLVDEIKKRVGFIEGVTKMGVGPYAEKRHGLAEAHGCTGHPDCPKCKEHRSSEKRSEEKP